MNGITRDSEPQNGTMGSHQTFDVRRGDFETFYMASFPAETTPFWAD